MELLQQFHIWTKGEIMQGRLMLAFSILLLPIILLVIKSTHSLQRGITIPFVLLFVVQFSYGSYLLISRTKQQQQSESRFQQNQQQAITNELSKAENDSKTYTLLKYAWGIFTVISLIGYLSISSEYCKGLALG
ncbi:MULTISPECIES: hypothetical protein [Chryseobacterium]|uniref:Uncharacterized protein (UPF0333 family) n=1 Tax=Chryseobacterium camelliae TaxID=1265445 RepID=A0ABU0TKT5_9FLAO|nr:MULTISPECIES: hypothetical protein [Chryseobacterium]MDT3408487.1 uncharacterized protein (UPF0333 family) [Pseudacidovorax intermedius]MDQ1097658.1 uncharacterized protein (UPF0333 family) [Chryseobacterium camelliae]MDQ1101587.1 uncharacterized protein (UPF0333 family) [Chryseobacterium sp. SORGH_AS_1048]MDR6085030.1 uncharacterized protein (UPF0333 family) [Chryseobacterium sp. SORGH_AS_0909]MDR6129385.1 uncharacterized protein (UPF0333 family) [Chryseobacterium sp. SORGH_AS_1175]